MKIGVLGSGLMGGKLGTIFARAGHEVVFSYSRDDKKLQRLARDAGGSSRAGTPGEAAKDADAVLIKGVLYGIAAVLPYMQKQKSGHIINVSSVAGHKVRTGGVVYSATKTAVRVLSEGLRQEVKPYNIRTTVISPGAVDTELPNTISDPGLAKGIREFYASTAIPPDSFARAVEFAMSQPEDVDINEILYRPTRQEN